MAPSPVWTARRHRTRDRPAAHRGRLPCRPPEISRCVLKSAPADRHPPDPRGAAPPARRLRPVPRRRRRAGRSGRSAGRGQVAGRRMRPGPRPAGLPDRDRERRAAAWCGGSASVSPTFICSAPGRPCRAPGSPPSTAAPGLRRQVAAPHRQPDGRQPSRHLRPHRARQAPRQGPPSRPQARAVRRRAPAPAAHRHQEAALCRDLPGARLCLRRGEALYRGDGAPAGRARRLERSRGGGPGAGRSRDGGPSDGGRGPAAQGPRQAGGVRRQAPPSPPGAGLEGVQEGRAVLARPNVFCSQDRS